MDRQGVETSVLSVLGTSCWIEAAGGSIGAGMSPSQQSPLQAPAASARSPRPTWRPPPSWSGRSRCWDDRGRLRRRAQARHQRCSDREL